MKTILLVFFLTGTCGFSKGFSQQAIQKWPEVCNIQVTHTGSDIKLDWHAKAEPGDLYYVVERSVDGIHFTTAGIVLGGFERCGEYSYRFWEKNNLPFIYYRIKQVKQDGRIRIAAERSV